MALQPGIRLGPYEILSALGAGGMGEVYRARDARLERDVAIKVLPSAFARDADRVARFEREAKAIAALSHPNVLAIFDTGLHDGRMFLVSELLEGETLSARLNAGPLPLRKTIDWGGQMARGLAAAHDKGVIHRDLKPDNIFITADGHAKILDFGLARTATITADATMTAAPITEAGTVMGTAGYMSPEQVRGEAIDQRSDLFSLGAVLYEMLTGARAFRRDTTAETMTAILRDEPPDVSAARTDLPPSLDRIVHHCLEKQPKERFQSARDVAFALDALSGSGATAASGLPIAAARTGVTRERLAWSALVFALVVALTLVGMKSSRPDGTAQPYFASIVLPDGLVVPVDVPAGRRLAISPDGRHVAFVGKAPGQRGKLWLQALDRPTATAVDGSDAAIGPFWSPDSRFVAFKVGPTLMKVAATGGPATAIGPASGAGTWNADDVILVGNESPLSMSSSTALRVVSKNGGDSSEVMQADPGAFVVAPAFLPDGQNFLFAQGSTSRDAGVFLGRLGSTGKRRLAIAQLDADNMNVLYASGYVLGVRNRDLVARTFDPGRLAIGSDVVRVIGPVEAQTPGGAAFTASQNGVLVYQQPPGKGARLVQFDRSGRQLSVLGGDAEYSNLELSPDGSQLLVSVSDPVARTRDIWVVDVARGVRTRLTFDPSDERSAVWTPDGKGVVYTSKGLDLYTRTLGAGAETALLVDHVSKDPMGFSPDGRFLVYRASGGKTRNDLWIQPVAPTAKPYPLLNSPFDENSAMLSGDGRWLAYVSDESGEQEVYVTAFPSGRGKWRISASGGIFPRWRRDGRELFYLAQDLKMMSVKVSEEGGVLTVAAARPLFQTTVSGSLGRPYDVSADGERFLINTAVASASASLTIVFNWPQLIAKQGTR